MVADIIKFGKKTSFKNVVSGKYDNIVFVDFTLMSMLSEVESYYREDPSDPIKNYHISSIVKFYDRKRFNDHDTINAERYKYMKEIDIYTQMRSDNQ